MNEPVNHDDDAPLLEPPPTDDELHAAEALRAALERPSGAQSAREHSADDALLEVAMRARAVIGHARPLDARVRTAAVDAALHGEITLASSTRRRTRTGPWLAAAAALLVAVSGAALAVRFVERQTPVAARTLPDEAYARPTDALFSAGLAPGQPASARLDRIVRSRTRGYFAVVAAELATEHEGGAK